MAKLRSVFQTLSTATDAFADVLQNSSPEEKVKWLTLVKERLRETNECLWSVGDIVDLVNAVVYADVPSAQQTTKVENGEGGGEYHVNYIYNILQ